MELTDLLRKEEKVKAVLVGVVTHNDSIRETEASLDELEQLLDTAGGEAVARVLQAKATPDVRTYIGKGKVEELKELCKANEIKLAVFDDELSPSQIKNLEEDLENIDVIDRSMLILDIFALHAVSGEGKLQVELAQLKYTTPRLIGKGSEMSRLGGGIGTRGPGESKLESDRRHIKRRIAYLEEQLHELENNRYTQRKQRERSQIKKVAIAGYTNAGKSTLLNYLTGAGILAQDKLFATLDPTTRKYKMPTGTEILLTDTVGFIRNLPHHLVRAFKSTLDEVKWADIIIILIDATDPQKDVHIEVSERLLEELGASQKPVLYVYNKCDLAEYIFPKMNIPHNNIIYISSKTGAGVDTLINRIEELVLDGKTTEVFKIPNSEQGVLNTLYKFAIVNDIEYTEDFIIVNATVDEKVKGKLKKYLWNV